MSNNRYCAQRTKFSSSTEHPWRKDVVSRMINLYKAQIDNRTSLVVDQVEVVVELNPRSWDSPRRFEKLVSDFEV